MDVVIPLGPNDEDIVLHTISSIRTHIPNVQTIYVVAHRLLDISGAKVLPESIFPFQLSDLSGFIPSSRKGWYFQQLLKLYAPTTIPGILPNVLIVDADTVFFSKVRFLDGEKYLFDYNNETNKPYFEHMKRLHPSFEAWKPKTSGITNMMILNREILQGLFSKVEEYHKEPFWVAFLKCIDPKAAAGAGASEYEIYFHYIMRNFPSNVKIRRLRQNNFGSRGRIESGGYETVTFHWHHSRSVPV
jgi:hypothetical protein